MANLSFYSTCSVKDTQYKEFCEMLYRTSFLNYSAIYSFGYSVHRVLQTRNDLCLCFIDEKQRSFQMSGNPCEKDMQYISVRPKGGFHFPGLSSFPPPASFFINFCGICLWINSQGGVVVSLWCWRFPGGIKCVSPLYSLLYAHLSV